MSAASEPQVPAATAAPAHAVTMVSTGSAAAPPAGESQAAIRCCLCGTKIQSNPSNMCINCLQHQVNLAEAIPKTYALPQCPNCDRFESGGHFVSVQWESRELLAVCLRKMSRLTKEVRLVDAGFIWTEPHSRRLKLKLTVQKEVWSGALMQQTFAVEFVLTSQQCTDCQKSFTEHTWTGDGKDTKQPGGGGDSKSAADAKSESKALGAIAAQAPNAPTLAPSEVFATAASATTAAAPPAASNGAGATAATAASSIAATA